MEKFANDFRYVNFIVSHNVEFHIKSIQTELMRSCVYFDFSKKKIIDIISFNHDLKYPSLKKLSLDIIILNNLVVVSLSKFERDIFKFNFYLKT